MQNPYIPPKDADLATWLLNFATLIAAAPATYGLTSTDAAAITGVQTAYQSAYNLAIDPPTRTKPTVADKDAAKAAALAVVRPYAIQIRNNAGVTNEDKEDLGLNIPDYTPTPIPAPTSSPVLAFIAATPLQHTLRYTDSVSPTTRGKKPAGVLGVQVWRAVGVAAAVDPATCSLNQVATKNPMASNFDSGDRGKIATYFARYVTRSGPLGVAQVGPWSDPVSAYVT